MNEREFKQNNSSDLFTFTRVTSVRKQARKAVGITINPQILEEARNRNLNISRICEQALASILEYVQPQNETVSSLSLTGCSLPRENPRAGSSAWYERRIRNAEVVGSNPARSTPHFSAVLFSVVTVLPMRANIRRTGRH